MAKKEQKIQEERIGQEEEQPYVGPFEIVGESEGSEDSVVGSNPDDKFGKNGSEDSEDPSNPDDKFGKNDREFLEFFLTKCKAPSNEMKEKLLVIFRRYIHPNQPNYKSCGSCSGTFSDILFQMREFWSKNNNKFGGN